MGWSMLEGPPSGAACLRQGFGRRTDFPRFSGKFAEMGWCERLVHGGS
jgi:hypothetical protein